jgi:hypothetical protein
MSDIPRANKRLRKLAKQIIDPMTRYLSPKQIARRIRTICSQDLPRRKCLYRAKGTRATMTRALALKIRAFASGHPKWTQQRIAEKFNVTNARVSEILHP